MPDHKNGFISSILDHIVGKAPDPPRPQPPKAPDVVTPGTRTYALGQAQDDARKNPAFRPTGKAGDPTFCNTATYEIVKRMGGPLEALAYENGTPAVANDMARYLAADAGARSARGSWRGIEDTKVAQRLANEGTLVLAVQPYTGKDEKGNPNHGHIATVRPEEISGLRQSVHENLAPDQKFAPIINNIGRNIAIESADTAFKEGLRIYYYTPNR